MKYWVHNILSGILGGLLTLAGAVIIGLWKTSDWVSGTENSIGKNADAISRLAKTQEKQAQAFSKIPLLLDKMDILLSRLDKHEERMENSVSVSQCNRMHEQTDRAIQEVTDRFSKAVDSLEERMSRLEGKHD